MAALYLLVFLYFFCVLGVTAKSRWKSKPQQRQRVWRPVTDLVTDRMVPRYSISSPHNLVHGAKASHRRSHDTMGRSPAMNPRTPRGPPERGREEMLRDMPQSLPDRTPLTVESLCAILAHRKTESSDSGRNGDETPDTDELEPSWPVAAGPETVDAITVDKLMGRWYEVITNGFVQSTTDKGAMCNAVDFRLSDMDWGVSAAPLSFSIIKYWGEMDPGMVVPTPDTPRVQIQAQMVEPGKLALKYGNGKGNNCTSDTMWILMLGPTDATGYYSYAVLSDPYLITLSVIARSVPMFIDNYAGLVLGSLYNLGFTAELNKPVFVNHDSCTYPPGLYMPSLATEESVGGFQAVSSSAAPTSTTADPTFQIASLQPTTFAAAPPALTTVALTSSSVPDAAGPQGSSSSSSSSSTPALAAENREREDSVSSALRIALIVVGTLFVVTTLLAMVMVVYRRTRPMRKRRRKVALAKETDLEAEARECQFCSRPSCQFDSPEQHVIGPGSDIKATLAQQQGTGALSVDEPEQFVIVRTD